MSKPQKLVEVVCHHDDTPKPLGKFHPATIEVLSPACTTKKGIPKTHPGPASSRGR